MTDDGKPVRGYRRVVASSWSGRVQVDRSTELYATLEAATLEPPTLVNEHVCRVLERDTETEVGRVSAFAVPTGRGGLAWWNPGEPHAPVQRTPRRASVLDDE